MAEYMVSRIGCREFLRMIPEGTVDLIYADMDFNDLNLDWIDLCKLVLKETGVIYIHTDQRSVCEVKAYADKILTFQNWCIWGYDWGGRPRNKWGNKHDDILFFSKSDKWNWYTDAISIPKKTLINSTKTMKIPTDTWTDVWDDIGTLHTMSKEKDEGKHRLYQKPKALLHRIIAAHCKAGDVVLDPFMGSGTTGVVAKEMGCSFYGCDIDSEAVKIARERMGLDRQENQ